MRLLKFFKLYVWFTYISIGQSCSKVKQPHRPDTRLGIMVLVSILPVSHREKKVSLIENIFPFITTVAFHIINKYTNM